MGLLVLGVFASRRAASEGLIALIDAGIEPSRIGLLMSEATRAGATGGPPAADDLEELASTSRLLPRVGLYASGPLWRALADLPPNLRHLSAALRAADIPATEAAEAATAVAGGGIVLGVEASDDEWPTVWATLDAACVDAQGLGDSC